MSGRFVSLQHPRRVVVDTSAPQPARFLIRLQEHALNHGMPATRRRGRRVATVLARRGLPVGAVAATLRALPGRDDPALRQTLDQVAAAWPDLRDRHPGLPGSPPDLSCLVSRRSGGQTVFVFGEEEHPLVVLTSDDGAGRRREARALEVAAECGLAPQSLGRVGSWLAQEGIRGWPLWLAPRSADALSWPDPTLEHLRRLGVGLTRLGEHSRRPEHPDRLPAAFAEVERAPLAERTLRAVAAARRDLDRLGCSVLVHEDLSAQNWLVDGDRLAGVVDWEWATPRGLPGVDSLNAAVALVEHGIALRAWHEPEVVEAVVRGWDSAPVFAVARASVRRQLEALGVPDSLAEPVEVAFFAARLATRLQGRLGARLGPPALGRMLEGVVG